MQFAFSYRIECILLHLESISKLTGNNRDFGVGFHNDMRQFITRLLPLIADHEHKQKAIRIANEFQEHSDRWADLIPITGEDSDNAEVESHLADIKISTELLLDSHRDRVLYPLNVAIDAVKIESFKL